MNQWQCARCGFKAIGVGGAIGLRAIGWWVKIPAESSNPFASPEILCPLHRPDPIPCVQEGSEHIGEDCAPCAARTEALAWQALIELVPPGSCPSNIRERAL